MKTFIYLSILWLFTAAGATMQAQAGSNDYLGLPGDNLNLFAVLKLFQDSPTLEAFEKGLNDENTRINNLDLDGDNRIDYLRVYDDVDGNVHNIVIQDPLGGKEVQDVAVITVQRDINGHAQIQVTGDEELYGRNYIIEPNMDDAYATGTPNPGYSGNRNVVYTSTVEIATWPIVRYMFLPTYVVWHSPWYYGYYPAYWHPWNPFSWHFYVGYFDPWNHYYGSHYRRWDVHRYNHWNDYYYHSRRSVSVNVNNRIHTGYYKTTYAHPEQRKAGEAMYHSNHPNNPKPGYHNAPHSTTVRRSTYSPSTGHSSTGSSSGVRRSTSGTPNRSVSGGPVKSTSTTTTTRSTSVTHTQPSTQPVRPSQPTVTHTTRTTTTQSSSSVRSSGSQSPRRPETSTVRKSTTTQTHVTKSSSGSSTRSAAKSRGETSKSSDKTRKNERR